MKVTVRLPESLVASVREAADEERRTFTATLQIAMEDYLRRRQPRQGEGATDAR